MGKPHNTRNAHEIPSEGLETEEMFINMGPQHPSTHGVLRLLLKTDGEIVSEVTPIIGYLHRALEKIAEKVSYQQFMPYTDRLDYLAAMNCNLAYAMAVEKLAGIEVPRRAEYIRVIMAELNRIASHLVAFGTFANDLGAWTPLLYGFREREEIINLFEMTCGQRLTYNYIRIGGVSRDIPDGFISRTRECLDYLEKRIEEYNQLFSYNRIMIERTANIGVLSPEDAIAYGVTGPNLRASGVNWDIRKHEPYSVYNEFDFDIPVGRGERGTVGDCWDRYMLRIREMQESIRIIRQALDRLPNGDVQAKVPRVFKPPVGEIYFRAENPRGECGFYIISDGSPNPYRIKIRGASFCHMSVFHLLARGLMIADIIAVLGSLDIVLPDIDR